MKTSFDGWFVRAFRAAAYALCTIAIAVCAFVAFGAEGPAAEREKTLEWFRREMYGRAPVGRPADEKIGERSVSFGNGRFTIRVHCSLPKGADKDRPAPVFLFGDHCNAANSATRTWEYPGVPTNAITARGYAYVRINFNDVAPNTYCRPGQAGDWSNGVHSVYGVGKGDDWGTLSAWAWAFSRAMDWIETRPELNAREVAVLGISRGGKTALWAAVQDERFAMGVSTCSGTGGARFLGLEIPEAEHLKDMLEGSVHFWFCPNFRKYVGREATMPHDADDLIGLIAPRLAYVASASKDDWAGPRGEFEAARRASRHWEKFGKTGLALKAFGPPGTVSHEGSIGYHLHDGPHELNAYDWARFIDFADRHFHPVVGTGNGAVRTTADAARERFGEPQRAQFHFTPEVGWMNDPNGLCRYKDEWHLFYQANPDGLGWGSMRWGHAVSKDLVHWEHLPIALSPDEHGTVFSGSAVVDQDGVAGFGKGELLLFYTAAGKDFTQRMAHSSDGRKFVKVPGDPILPVQGKENRDPHVFRHHDGHWVMVLYVPSATNHNFNVYNSFDLRHWKLASVVPGPAIEDVDFYDWELPQLFELPVSGTKERRWVLMGASGSYAVGSFDGATFVPEARGLSPVVRAEPGGNWPKPNWPKFGYNSSLVFAGNADGRTILASWYHLFTKGEKFTQAAGLPLEAKLLPTQDGPRLAYFPVRELEVLRQGGAVPLERFSGELLEAYVSCRVTPGARATYSFRGVDVVYDRNSGTLTIAGESVPWQTENGRLRLHVYQDRIGIEVFDPSGLQAFVQPKAFPSRTNLRISFVSTGKVLDQTSAVWRLSSIHGGGHLRD